MTTHKPLTPVERDFIRAHWRLLVAQSQTNPLVEEPAKEFFAISSKQVYRMLDEIDRLEAEIAVLQASLIAQSPESE